MRRAGREETFATLVLQVLVVLALHMRRGSCAGAFVPPRPAAGVPHSWLRVQAKPVFSATGPRSVGGNLLVPLRCSDSIIILADNDDVKKELTRIQMSDVKNKVEADPSWRSDALHR